MYFIPAHLVAWGTHGCLTELEDADDLWGKGIAIVLSIDPFTSNQDNKHAVIGPYFPNICLLYIAEEMTKNTTSY